VKEAEIFQTIFCGNAGFSSGRRERDPSREGIFTFIERFKRRDRIPHIAWFTTVGLGFPGLGVTSVSAVNLKQVSNPDPSVP